MDVDHLVIPVADYERSKHFYADVLEPLGFVVLMDWHQKRRAYLGVPPAPSSLWLVESQPTGGLDISLPAADPETVDTFYRCALAAGARIVDEPGVRLEHNATYYAVRIVDPDGNSLEVVHRAAGAVAA